MSINEWFIFHEKRIEPDIPEVIESEEPPKPLVSMVTGEPFGPRVQQITEKTEDDSSDDEPESESDEELKRLTEDVSEVPSEFWHIQKLIRYMKAGNQTATLVALCLLKDYDLSSRVIVKSTFVYFLAYWLYNYGFD